MQSKNSTVEYNNKPLPITTYDCPTFYRNIPHNKLKNVMRELTNFPFKGDEKQFLAVTKFCSAWTGNKTEAKITLDKASLKLDITFVLNNCFSNFGNLPFRQIAAILHVL